MDKYVQKMHEGISIINRRDKTKKYVAIFDIDETIIHENSLIQPIYKLYQYALQEKIGIIFITAREGSSQNIKWTAEQLSKLNITYITIYFRPEYITDIESYKIFCRKNVTESGYEPLFSIGDMYWDVGIFGGISLYI